MTNEKLKELNDKINKIGEALANLKLADIDPICDKDYFGSKCPDTGVEGQIFFKIET